MIEPIGYIGADAFEAISGGETIQPTMTPKVVCEDDAPLYAIPAGYVLVPVEPTEAMLNAARDWSYEKYGKPIGNEAAIGCYKAMIEGEQC